MIIFKKVRYKNLLSTGNIFTELNLNNHSTTLVIGKNGSGKSTLIEALSFGLYGKPFRKINKPQLLNVITKKELVVEIEFAVGIDEYKVVRGMKPNIFELYKNGELLNQDAASKDYQETLEKQILKINHRSFCQVVVLGTASYVPFMQMPAATRREFNEDILDLQIFTTMNVLLKDKINNNTEQLNDIIVDKRAKQSQLELHKTHYDTIQKSNEKFIEERKSKITSTKTLILEAELEIEKLISEGKILKELLNEKDAFKNKMGKFDEYRLKFNEKIRTATNIISFFHNNTTCPTCQQGIEEDFRNNMIIEKEASVKDIDIGLSKLEVERLKLSEKIDNLNTISNKVINLSLTLSQLNVKMLNWRENSRQWQKEIDDVINNNEFISKDSISNLVAELDSIEKLNIELTDQKSTYSMTSAILKDGGIKSMIIKQYIPIINKLINKYLASMDFFVNFELNEQFEETIKSRGRDEFSYASFSEGEKLRIDLAFLFTWRAIAKLRNSVNTNLLILDEVFDSSLDVNGADEFMKILKNMTADNNTFIISHRGDQMVDKFEKVLSFEKVKNFSRIAKYD